MSEIMIACSKCGHEEIHDLETITRLENKILEMAEALEVKDATTKQKNEEVFKWQKSYNTEVYNNGILSGKIEGMKETLVIFANTTRSTT